MLHLLILEDHDLSRVNLEQNLRREGFGTTAFATGQEALVFLEAGCPGPQGPPLLALLDRSLPDMDGLEVMRWIRSNDGLRDMGIIMLTARGEELDRVLGLELGADDYVTKPFSFPELLARIRAIARRNHGRAKALPERWLQRNDLRIDLEGFSVTAHGLPVELTRREFELLVFLLRHPGQVMTRQQLMRQVWKAHAPDEGRTVDVHVRRLRAKLGTALSGLETVIGVGYRLD